MKILPGLYIVSTPIGNLDDITLRAINVLKSSDIILCEDTRISQKLLAKHDIQAKCDVYNDKSTEKQRLKIKDYIDQKMVVSLISDAGTPLISDPGYKLVQFLRNNNCKIDVLPGPSSPIAALTLSGMPTDRFLFHGFLPKSDVARANIFKSIQNLNATLVFFETAQRLAKSLANALEILGDRSASVVREMTKLYQEVHADRLSKLKDHYLEYPTKGEIVLIISGCNVNDFTPSLAELENTIQELIDQGMSAKLITEKLHDSHKAHFSKNDIYRKVNKMKHD